MQANNNNPVNVHSFTLKGNGIINCIHTPIEIAIPEVDFDYDNAIKTKIRGIWDTGASATVITSKVVKSLNLKPTGQTQVNTASESNKIVNTYLVDVFLNNKLRISGVQVTLGTIVDGIDCLIGMDVINLGDFSITNFGGKTTMSFRIPSLHEIDYYKAIRGVDHRTAVKIERNNSCPCGSGKKYKKCCGK